MFTETHRCVGNTAECETIAFCEECGHKATPDQPVSELQDEEGAIYLCSLHVSKSASILSHQPARWIENPETGEGSYAATTADGHPVLASGAIEGCACGECEGREAFDAESDWFSAGF